MVKRSFKDRGDKSDEEALGLSATGCALAQICFGSVDADALGAGACAEAEGAGYAGMLAIDPELVLEGSAAFGEAPPQAATVRPANAKGANETRRRKDGRALMRELDALVGGLFIARTVAREIR